MAVNPTEDEARAEEPLDETAAVGQLTDEDRDAVYVSAPLVRSPLVPPSRPASG